jgi:hypothetical protein
VVAALLLSYLPLSAAAVGEAETGDEPSIGLEEVIEERDPSEDQLPVDSPEGETTETEDAASPVDAEPSEGENAEEDPAETEDAASSSDAEPSEGENTEEDPTTAEAGTATRRKAAASTSAPALLVEGDAAVTLAVDEDYPWAYDASKSDGTHVAYVAGNSGTTAANVSNLAITVTGAGMLTFEYKISTPSSGSTYAYYYNLGAPVTSENYTKVANYSSYMSNRGKSYEYWRTETITVTSDDLVDGSATVYVAYYRGGTSGDSNNYVAISNVKYVAGEQNLTITGASDGLGTVRVEKKTVETVTETHTTKDEDGNEITTTTTKQVDVYTPYDPIGDGVYQLKMGEDKDVYLTAEPKKGAQFYGWVDVATGEYLSGETTYILSFGGATTIQAVFADAGTYTARLNSTFYTDAGGGLEQALTNARSGDTVVMLADQTLSSSATVSRGVFLLLPCMDADVGYVTANDRDHTTHSPDGTNAHNDTNTLYGTLTIPSGVTLTVEGEVLVNAQVGRPAGGDFDQDVNGNYAQIDLDGSIVVENGGWLENYGYITGSGQVTAESGSTLVDLYVVRSWRGGSQAYAVVVSAAHEIYPMNEIDCHNIQAAVRIESGASYQGAVRMYAGGGFNYTRFPQVDDDNGLIRLASGAYLIKTYDPDYAVTDSSGTYTEGRSTIEIYGGAAFAYSALPIVGVSVSTQSYVFPIDGDIALKLYAGEYTVQNDFKLMPGCTVDLMEGAAVTVGPEVTDAELAPDADGIATLVLYDEFDDVDNTSTTEYPSYRPAATLTVHGGAALTVDAKGAIAGRIVLADGATKDNYAKVRLSNKTALTVTSYEANGYYQYTTTDENGKSVVVSKTVITIPLTFTAQLWDDDETPSSLTPKAGQTYYGIAGTWTTTSPVVLPGDLDGNNEVNSRDLAMLLENFNKSGNGLKGDIDDNGEVNSRDLAILLENFNKSLSD